MRCKPRHVRALVRHGIRLPVARSLDPVTASAWLLCLREAEARLSAPISWSDAQSIKGAIVARATTAEMISLAALAEDLLKAFATVDGATEKAKPSRDR